MSKRRIGKYFVKFILSLSFDLSMKTTCFIEENLKIKNFKVLYKAEKFKILMTFEFYLFQYNV